MRSAPHSTETRIVLRLDPDSDPISGRIEIEGSVRAFSGWLMLSTLLEQAIHPAGEDEPADEL